MSRTIDRRQFVSIGSTGALAVLTRGLSETLADEVADPAPAKAMYDAIVIGLGAMGSACVYQLARRGASVLGLEQFDIAHALGSSGGIARQTKVVVYQGSPYLPLIRRANENWQALEKHSGQKIFHACGYLRLGPPWKPTSDARAKIEMLDEAAIAERFPQIEALPPQTRGVFDHEGGLLRSELAIAVHCQVALQNGGHIRAQEPVTDWNADEDGVNVITPRGRYRAKHLVIAAGAWNAKLIAELRGKLDVTRLTTAWFAPKTPKIFSMDRFPVWEHGAFYGFPVLPDYPGLKVAKHWHGAPADPDDLDRTLRPDDEKTVRDYLGRHIPAANGSMTAFKACMYTHGGPWLGLLPGEKRVTCIAACNGGGFKFSSAYGEALADFATRGKTTLPVAFMAWT